MTTLAITGTGGFIGLRMAERARALGWQVRGLDVSEAAAERARAAGAEVRVGDVTDPEAVSRLCEGADFLLHTAAIVEEDGELARYRKVNVEGTRTVARAARASGVGRLVHLSSVMVYGFDYPPDVTEYGPFRGENNAYCETKILSERVAMSFHDPGWMEVVAIRPGDVYGPGGAQWVLRPFQMLQRRLFTLPDVPGVMNHVYVDNLVDGVLRALETPHTGEAYNITDGRPTPCPEFYAHHARFAGGRPIPKLPPRVLRAAIGAMAAVHRAAGRKPPGLPSVVDYLSRRHAYSIDKARRLLGYEPSIDLEEGMDRVHAWLKERGLARA